MNKILFPVIALGLFAASCSSNDSARKKDFMSTCISTAQSNFGSSVNQGLTEDYCACSYEKLNGSLSQSEWTELDKPNPGSATVAKAKELTQPCLDEFVKKASAPSGK